MALGTILVADDEESLREMLHDALAIADYSPVLASDGQEALKLLQVGKFDLAILDVNMPGLTGFQILKSIRESGNNLPVILLTAQTERNHVSEGLRLGADDYVRKPFGLEELLLRVQAVLRRSNHNSNSEDAVLRCGPLELNRDTYLVRFNGEIVEVSPTEFKLLDLLMSKKNKVVKKSEMLSEVWDINFETSTNVVDTYISYLRKKLHRDGFQGIKTVRGIGFQIDDDK